MPHPRPEPSGEASPSVEGLPRQGRGEAGKGRGPRVATQRVGRRAKRASCPAPDKKRAAFRQPFSFIWRRGGESKPHHSQNPCSARLSARGTRIRCPRKGPRYHRRSRGHNAGSARSACTISTRQGRRAHRGINEDNYRARLRSSGRMCDKCRAELLQRQLLHGWGRDLQAGPGPLAHPSHVYRQEGQ